MRKGLLQNRVKTVGVRLGGGVLCGTPGRRRNRRLLLPPPHPGRREARPVAALPRTPHAACGYMTLLPPPADGSSSETSSSTSMLASPTTCGLLTSEGRNIKEYAVGAGCIAGIPLSQQLSQHQARCHRQRDSSGPRIHPDNHHTHT